MTSSIVSFLTSLLLKNPSLLLVTSKHHDIFDCFFLNVFVIKKSVVTPRYPRTACDISDCFISNEFVINDRRISQLSIGDQNSLQQRTFGVRHALEMVPYYVFVRFCFRFHQHHSGDEAEKVPKPKSPSFYPSLAQNSV